MDGHVSYIMLHPYTGQPCLVSHRRCFLTSAFFHSASLASAPLTLPSLSHPQAPPVACPSTARLPCLLMAPEPPLSDTHTHPLSVRRIPSHPIPRANLCPHPCPDTNNTQAHQTCTYVHTASPRDSESLTALPLNRLRRCLEQSSSSPSESQLTECHLTSLLPAP